MWSRLFIPDPGSGSLLFTHYGSKIPDPGGKKAPEPGPGSATLFKSQIFASTRRFRALLNNIRIFWRNLAQRHTVIVWLSTNFLTPLKDHFHTKIKSSFTCGIAEIHIVWRLLDEYRAGQVLTAPWKNFYIIVFIRFGGIMPFFLNLFLSYTIYIHVLLITKKKYDSLYLLYFG